MDWTYNVPLWGWALYGVVLVVLGNVFHADVLIWVSRHVPNLSFLDSIGSALAFIIAAQISSNRDANYARLQLISNLRRVSLAFLRAVPNDPTSQAWANDGIKASLRFVFDMKRREDYVDVRFRILKVLENRYKPPELSTVVVTQFADDCDSIYYSFRNLRFRSFSVRARVFQTVLTAVYIGCMVILFHAQNTLAFGIVTTQLFIGAFVGLQQITAAPNEGAGDARFQREQALAFDFLSPEKVTLNAIYSTQL